MRVLVTALGVVALLGTTLAALQLFEHQAHQHQHDYEASLRTCEIISDPAGAAIWLDGRPYKDHAPALLKLERDREYLLELRTASATVERRIKNQRKLVMRVQAGQQPYEDDLWEGQPPALRRGRPSRHDRWSRRRRRVPRRLCPSWRASTPSAPRRSSPSRRSTKWWFPRSCA